MYNQNVDEMPEVFNEIIENISIAIECEDDAYSFIENLRKIPGLCFKKSIYFLSEEEKNAKKIMGAINGYARVEKNEFPLVCFDNTTFGSASEGCLITTRGIYLHNLMEEACFLLFKNIHSIELRGIISKDIYINDYKLDTNLMESEDKEDFVQLMSMITGKFNNPDMNHHLSENEKQTKKQTQEIVYDPAEVQSYLEDLRQMYKKFKFKRSIYYWNENEKGNKKFQSAIEKYAKLAIGEIPLLCFDNTVFGTASEGCLITTKGIYTHNIRENVNFFDFKIFVEGELKGFINKDIYINSYKLDTTCMDTNAKEAFVELINILFEKFSGADSLHENYKTKYTDDDNDNEERQKKQDESQKDKETDYNYVTLDECYEILGCTSKNSMKELRENYKNLIKQYHPDLFANTPKEFIDLANKKMKMINIAYNRICEYQKQH